MKRSAWKIWMALSILSIVCKRPACRVLLEPSLVVSAFSPKIQPQRTKRLVSTSARKKKATEPIKTTDDSPPLVQLVIVESPAKCATIAKILNDYASQHGTLPFQVVSCMGHIRNLSTKKPESPQPPQFPYSIPGIDLGKKYSPMYEILPEKSSVIRALKEAAASAHEILLATDADREGEAMAWHLTQVLGSRYKYKRISFVELTPTAVVGAVQNPYELNPHLIAAQETRRVLDRLAGFTLSPLLWKKISPGLSGGRVQSVGMSLIVHRERERLMFPSTPYWKLTGQFQDDESRSLNQVLFTLQSLNETIPVARKTADFVVESVNENEARATTEKYHISSATSAQELIDRLETNDTLWTVLNVSSNRRTQVAPLPYKTSSLQQDAVRTLGWSVTQTMRVAQKLYEEGVITYMRTDSATLSQDADQVLKRLLKDRYRNVTASTKKRKLKSKFAQEAHEAIRPAILNGKFVEPSNIRLDEASSRLYRMIYQRTLASSMPPRITNNTRVLVQGKNKKFGSGEFVATGSVVLEPGYSAVYSAPASAAVREEGDDDGSPDSEAEAAPSTLPPIREGQVVHLQALRSSEHVTLPPPRYTEASFVKQLESLGVGRPSTYSKIIQILMDRAYVLSGNRGGGGNSFRRAKNAASGGMIPAKRASGQSDDVLSQQHRRGGSLVPTLSAFAVTSLLEKHCSTYVDPEFTAEMEKRLDVIARGSQGTDTDEDAADSEEERFQYLDEFYAGPDGLAARIKCMEQEVKSEDARRVTLPALVGNETNQVGLFVGPWGPYVQLQSSTVSSNTSDCDKPTTAPLPPDMAANLSLISCQSLHAVLMTKRSGGLLLGHHPDDGRSIRLKTGRFGAYLHWGDDGDESSTSHSLPREKAALVRASGASLVEGDSVASLEGLSWEEVVGYVNLPRIVCYLDNLPVVASIGPYGPYLKYNNSFVSLNRDNGDVLTIDPEAAERLVVDGIVNSKSKRSSGVLAELGNMEGSLVSVKSGRFGKYINWKTVKVKLPAEYADNPEALPLDLAWDLIQERFGKMNPSRKKLKAFESVFLPPAPKRPLSAYMHFCAANRPEILTTPMSLGDLSKRLSSMWAETTAEDRKPYEQMAAKDKSAYESLKKAWRLECQQKLEQNADKGSLSVKKGSGEATRKGNRKSAYLHFCDEMRPRVASSVKTFGEISKELSRLWAETSDRSRYEALAANFEQETEGSGLGGNAVEVKPAEAERGSTISLNGVQADQDESVLRESSKMRAPSAYILFCRECRPSLLREDGTKPSLGESAKQLAKLWKECSDDTRQSFHLQAEQAKKRLSQSL